MIKKFLLPYRQRISCAKYFKNARPSVFQFASVQRINLSNMNIIAQNASVAKVTSCSSNSRRKGALSLPKIARPQESDYQSEISNISSNIEKSRCENSTQIFSKNQKNPAAIFHIRQPKLSLGQNLCLSKNILYTKTIKKIKEMTLMNANQFCLTDHQKLLARPKPGLSLLLQRRGINEKKQNQNFKLQLIKSNFNLNKIQTNDLFNHNEKFTLKLKKYFNSMPKHLE